MAMNELVFKKVESLAKTVKEDLRKRGFVVPISNNDGSVSVDSYTITRENTGFYAIKDLRNTVIVENINLPQTAAVIANSLALGRWIDSELIRQDTIYGYKLFEEQLLKIHADQNIKKKDYDKADVNFTKAKIARYKKSSAKEVILKSFDKLRRLR
jgi:hypothetical protein